MTIRGTGGERAAMVAIWALAAAVLCLLYAPVVVGALFSVVEVRRSGVVWDSASLNWYAALWFNAEIWSALRSTLLVAALAVAGAVVLAVILALYVEWDEALGRRLIEIAVYLPFLLPPIVTGLSLLIFFAQFGVARGIATLAVGHGVFVLALVYRLVLTRLRALPRSLIEASADLGATRWQTFRLVIWPHLRGAVLTAALLGFALSFDETLISVFLSGNDSTLPLRLWAMMRVGFTPEINALVTMVLVVTIALAVLVSLRLRPAAGDGE